MAAEFAFVEVRPTRVNELVERGNPGAKLVQDDIRNPDHPPRRRVASVRERGDPHRSGDPDDPHPVGGDGEVEFDEVEMIESVFELGDPIVREIMVPRPDVETVPASMSLSELRSAAAIGAFTRYLVLDDDGEQAVGFVHVEDVLRASEAVTDQDHPLTARELARELFAVPETRRIDEILTDFQTRGEGQIAVVFDEWGTFEGIVTIEDVLEEFVGDIQDEFDTAAQELSIETRDDGTHVVDGGVPGRAVNDQLDTEFESDEVESIGGFVFSYLGRVPQVGDQIEQNRYVLEVEALEDARIDRPVIRRLRPEQGTRNESEN